MAVLVVQWVLAALLVGTCCVAAVPTVVLGDSDVVNNTAINKDCTRRGLSCLNEAECDRRRRQCICPESKTGDATIACVEKGDYQCVASGDTVHSYSGLEVPLALPCRYRLSSFLVQRDDFHVDSKFSHCRVEVFSLTAVRNNGDLYQKGIEVEIELGQQNPHQGRFVSNTDQLSLSIDDDHYFKFIKRGRLIKSPFTGGSATKVLRNGVKVFHYFSPYNQFASVYISSCDTLVQFRPLDRSRIKQRRKSGIVIQAPGRAQFRGNGLYPYSLCGTPHDDPHRFQSGGRGSGSNRKTTRILTDVLEAGVNQRYGECRHQCKKVTEVTKRCENRREVVAFCYRQLLSRNQLFKALKKGIHCAPVDSFQLCMKAYCDCILPKSAKAIKKDKKNVCRKLFRLVQQFCPQCLKGQKCPRKL